MVRAHDAIVEAHTDPPYVGKAGQTRLQPVHIVQSDGSAASRPMYRTINVGTHPELKERALAGELHRRPNGKLLALPFLYHDPEERRFALVLPDVLSHLELQEWASLMTELAEDTSAPVPRYVRHATTVIGYTALRTFTQAAAIPADSELSDADDDATTIPPSDGDASTASAGISTMTTPATDDGESPILVQREYQVAEQERGLSRMAESLTAREAEILRREEQVRTANVDLEIREQDLKEQRNSMLHEAQVVPPESPDSVWQEVAAQEINAKGRTPARRVVQEEATVVTSLATLARDAEAARLNSHPTLPLPGYRGSGPPPLRPAGNPPQPVGPPRLPRAQPRVENTGAGNTKSGRPETTAPTAFSPTATGTVSLKLVDEELWLFAALDGPAFEALGDSPELLLQCVLHDAHPVLVLSIADSRQERVFARHVLNGFSDEASQVIGALETAYRARLALFANGIYRDTITVASLREAVARAAREQIEAADSKVTPASADRAVSAVGSAPPPIDSTELPFGPARRPLASTTAVQAGIARLEHWLTPDRIRDAMLLYSVPRHVIEASARRILRAAMSFGVHLSGDMTKKAIDYGVVAGPSQLICNQLVAFRLRVKQGENDLSEQATQENWNQLLAQARTHGVEVDSELRALASTPPPQTGLSAPPADSSRADRLALVEQLSQPATRTAAFTALCLRKESSQLPLLMQSLEDMLPEEIARASAHLQHFDDGLADPIGRGLRSKNVHIRQASALLVGRMKQRRNLAPLIQRIDEEPTEHWPELARAVGEFGIAALRTVGRTLAKAQHPERYVVALAHLSNHGCADEVEDMKEENPGALADAAGNAIARRSRLAWEDQAVRNQETLPDGSVAARFSQAFYAEAAKLDI